MSERFRLIFRGEVLPGQHPAVVRRRLSQAASFDEATLDRLFSGRPVVLKREADRATAARFQVLFKKAGARLRVVPAEAAAAHDSDSESAPASTAAAEPSSEAGLALLPPGAPVLRDDERTPWRPREIDTSHLKLDGAQYVVAQVSPPVPAPDVSHLTLAEPGENLGPEAPAPRRPAVDVDAIAFDVAEPGADLDTRERAAPPPAPDVSHLTLVDDE
ncbi:MAG TPA: hypothetical protein VF210_13520 [Pseudomonadales bacterium]